MIFWFYFLIFTEFGYRIQWRRWWHLRGLSLCLWRYLCDAHDFDDRVDVDDDGVVDDNDYDACGVDVDVDDDVDDDIDDDVGDDDIDTFDDVDDNDVILMILMTMIIMLMMMLMMMLMTRRRRRSEDSELQNLTTPTWRVGNKNNTTKPPNEQRQSKTNKRWYVFRKTSRNRMRKGG